jgi:hypothetical protein
MHTTHLSDADNVWFGQGSDQGRRTGRWRHGVGKRD